MFLQSQGLHFLPCLCYKISYFKDVEKKPRNKRSTSNCIKKMETCQVNNSYNDFFIYVDNLIIKELQAIIYECL